MGDAVRCPPPGLSGSWIPGMPKGLAFRTKLMCSTQSDNVVVIMIEIIVETDFQGEGTMIGIWISVIQDTGSEIIGTDKIPHIVKYILFKNACIPMLLQMISK